METNSGGTVASGWKSKWSHWDEGIIVYIFSVYRYKSSFLVETSSYWKQNIELTICRVFNYTPNVRFKWMFLSSEKNNARSIEPSIDRQIDGWIDGCTCIERNRGEVKTD